MVAKLMAVVVALFLLGGAIQATNFHVASTATVELNDPSVDAIVPMEPVVTVAPIRHSIAIEMPAAADLIAFAFAPQTFRPPRA